MSLQDTQQTQCVSLEWLVDHLDDPDVRIVDCRFVLGNPQAGLLAYLEGHLPGAFYFDLEQDLSGKVGLHGGRHPLPILEELADKLGAAGIDRSVKVVCYDDQGGAMASRFWWLLKYMGHANVALLEGGYTHWKERGYPVTADVPSATPRRFEIELQPGMIVEMQEVRERLNEEQTILIDAREEARYRGLHEPIDKVAGHIPGAFNAFWKEGLSETGLLLGAEKQKERFAKIPGLTQDKEVIVYCGSGVTACSNVWALTEAGYRNVKLYLGSWSDWSSYPENPIAVKVDEAAESKQE
jgi:thiosulfate/3-mercaptopyruvate sulfurtransferase